MDIGLVVCASRLGPAVPIVGTMDPHGNLSPRMVQASDALLAYRTNPHIDQFSCGQRAARLMARTLRGEIRPTQAAAFPPLVINIERQNTSQSPCREFYAHADRLLERPGVLANSLNLGFAYADVLEVGSSTLVVTDNDPHLAQQLADELAESLWAHREQFVAQLVSVEEAVEQAAQLEGPVCLLDMGDNVGGGSPADGTWLAHALHERRIARSFVCLFDPEAVAECAAAGRGQTLRLRVGGRSGPRSGEPLEAECQVLGLYQGKFHESEPRHGGFANFDQGPTAVVRTAGGLTIMITSRRTAAVQPGPTHQLRSRSECLSGARCQGGCGAPGSLSTGLPSFHPRQHTRLDHGRFHAARVPASAAAVVSF